VKFTDASLRALKPKTERYEAWESNGKGFGLRVSPAGRKTFIFMYRFDGMARRMTIGTYPALTLSQAHELHAKARQKLEKGVDPGVESVKGKRTAREAYTVIELVDDYIERHAKRKKRSWKEDDRILRKDVIPRWGKKESRIHYTFGCGESIGRSQGPGRGHWRTGCTSQPDTGDHTENVQLRSWAVYR